MNFLRPPNFDEKPHEELKRTPDNEGILIGFFDCLIGNVVRSSVVVVAAVFVCGGAVRLTKSLLSRHRRTF